jgi:type IV pilus assembly protein PilM
MRFFFQRFQRPKLLLGVDFADGQLRIVALRRLKRAAGGHLRQWSPEFELEGYAVAPLPDGAVVAGTIENGPAVSDCVQRLVSKLRMKSRRVAFAVKTSEALLLNTAVASGLSRREKEDRVIALAETALPYSLDEIYLDFAETRDDYGRYSRNGHHGDDQTAERITDNDQIVVVAAQLDAIDSRVAVCRDAGLDVEVADVVSLAQERLLVQLAEDQDSMDTILLITLENGLSSLALFLGGRHLATREWQFDVEELSSASSKGQVNELAQNYVWEDQEQQEQPDFASVRATIFEQLKFLLAQTMSGAPPTEVPSPSLALLAGSEARREGLDLALSACLGCPIRVADPFLKLGLRKDLDPAAVYRDAPTLLLATALALREAP